MLYKTVKFQFFTVFFFCREGQRNSDESNKATLDSCFQYCLCTVRRTNGDEIVDGKFCHKVTLRHPEWLMASTLCCIALMSLSKGGDRDEEKRLWGGGGGNDMLKALVTMFQKCNDAPFFLPWTISARYSPQSDVNHPERGGEGEKKRLLCCQC